MKLLFDFAIFNGDNLLHRGSLIFKKEEQISIFGEHIHTENKIIINNKEEIISPCIFRGAVFTYSYSEPACKMTIQYYNVKKLNNEHIQEKLYEGGFAIAVHNSEDWESINLGNIHTLAFRCNKQ